jgi:integrase
MSKQYCTVTLTLPNGKRKYFRGATKREAEKKRDAAKVALAMGVNVGDNTTVEELSAIWLRDYKQPEVRESSFIRLETIVRVHIVPWFGRMKVRDVKPAHVKSFMRSKADLARSTQSSILQTLKAIFALAVENEIILRSPCSKSITASGEETKEKVPLTPEQSARLLEEARGTPLYYFVLIGLYAGLRRGELLGLQWQDIDFEEGTLTVQRSIAPTKANPGGELTTTLKTDAARRTIPLPWSVINELRAAKAGSKSVYVVPGPNGNHFSFSLSGYHWNRLMENLPFDAHPHLMRHTRITRWFEQGLDLKEIQYLAGHTSLDMTLGVYTHYQAETRMKQTAEKIRAIS